MATVDLWPDEIATDGGLEGPTVLLKEQAALLGQKTKNLVEAEVETLPNPRNKEEFVDMFTILSAALNYRYQLLQVYYPLEFYPALVMRSDGNSIHVSSREDLEDVLQEIFADPKTVRVIQALISRSRG